MRGLFPISGSHDARFIPHFWESRLEGHLHGKRGLGAVKSCFPHPNQLKHEIKHQRGQIAFIIHSILSRTSPSFIKLKNQVSRIHHNLHEINNQGMLVFILGFPSILGVQEPFIKLRFYWFMNLHMQIWVVFMLVLYGFQINILLWVSWT